MDDEHLDPRVADELRSRLMREVVADRVREQRRSGAARGARAPRPHIRWVPALATAMVALLVIALSISVLLSVRAPDPAVPHVRSTRVLDGDCSALLSRSAVRSAVGTKVVAPEDLTTTEGVGIGAALAPLAVVGGLECLWGTTKGVKDSAGLVLAAAPVGLAPKKDPAPGCYGIGPGPNGSQTTCTFAMRSRGLWFSGLLTMEKGSKAATIAQLERLRPVLARAAKAPSATVRVPSRAADAWGRDLDCAALARRARLATVLHSPGLVGESGGGTSEPSAAQVAAERRVGVTACMVGGPYPGTGWKISNLDFTVVPGGAVLAGIVDADPTAKRVRLASGQVVVVTTTGPEKYRIIHVFSGSNYLQVNPEFSPLKHVLPAVDVLLRQLDASR